MKYKMNLYQKLLRYLISKQKNVLELLTNNQSEDVFLSVLKGREIVVNQSFDSRDIHLENCVLYLCSIQSSIITCPTNPTFEGKYLTLTGNHFSETKSEDIH